MMSSNADLGLMPSSEASSWCGVDGLDPLLGARGDETVMGFQDFVYRSAELLFE